MARMQLYSLSDSGNRGTLPYGASPSQTSPASAGFSSAYRGGHDPVYFVRLAPRRESYLNFTTSLGACTYKVACVTPGSVGSISLREACRDGALAN